MTALHDATDLDDWLPAEHAVAQVNHSSSRHGRRRRAGDAVHLEDDLAVVAQRDSIAVRQRQRSACVEQRIEMFRPDRIDWTVENQPRVFTFYTSSSSTDGLQRTTMSGADTGS